MFDHSLLSFEAFDGVHTPLEAMSDLSPREHAEKHGGVYIFYTEQQSAHGVGREAFRFITDGQRKSGMEDMWDTDHIMEGACETMWIYKSSAGRTLGAHHLSGLQHFKVHFLLQVRCFSLSPDSLVLISPHAKRMHADDHTRPLGSNMVKSVTRDSSACSPILTTALSRVAKCAPT